MPIDLQPDDEVVKALLSETTKRVFDNFIRFFKLKKKQHSYDVIDPSNLFTDKKIEGHLTFIHNWAKNIEFFDLTPPISTLNNTIRLDITFNLRKITNKEKRSNVIHEEGVFSSNDHYLIIGDPGSGKTTTLKRLIQLFIHSKDEFDMPLLIRFRDINVADNLYIHICKLLGIEYETRKKQQTKTYKTRDRYSNVVEQTRVIEYEEYYLLGEKLEQIIPELLSSRRFLILMDGLDEINGVISDSIIDEVIKLSMSISNSKIIITTRAYSNRSFTNFLICEICELTEPQSKQIIAFWCEQPDEFLIALSNKSYRDLANRPLFLTFLLILYTNNEGSDIHTRLPIYSRDVYEEIIDFFLKRWDFSRGIKYRKSSYEKFTINQKKNFLSELSFELTYHIKEKVFSKDHLRLAYTRIYKHYPGLIEDDSEGVILEIESHTGIIVGSFYNLFEFSHLSLQEYLCANFIVKQPYSPKIVDYLREFPSPLALVISISSNPTDWFSHIILKCLYPSRSTTFPNNNALILINRIMIENPVFEESIQFGAAVLFIAHMCDCTDDYFIATFDKFVHSQENIVNSVKKALKKYRQEGVIGEQERRNRKATLFYGLYVENQDKMGIDFPRYISCPLHLYDKLTQA
jgi:predicted NACHT family NTPase